MCQASGIVLQPLRHNNCMAVTFIRTLIIFVTLIIIMRLMGKRQIGEMQPFEFVVTLIIADLACIPMTDLSIPLIYGIVSILALFVLHQIFTLLEQGGPLIKKIISGKPSLVVNKNGVDIKELKRNNMGVEDLIESMRGCGYFSLEQVEYAIFESNGKLSVLERQVPQAKPQSLPLLIVNEGKVGKKNLELLKIDKTNIEQFLQSASASINTTEVLTIDGNGRSYLKQKNKAYKVLNFDLPKGVSW